MTAKPVQLKIYRTSIPMRSFEHAAATRAVAENIIVRLEYDDGVVGWGETLPREYVTGETLETVPEDIKRLWQLCIAGDLLCPAEMPAEIPTMCGERFVGAAAAALDVASFRRVIDYYDRISPDILQTLISRSRIRDYIDSRVSGVLGSAKSAKTKKRLRLMRLGGLTDFKLKLGFGEEVDRENLQICHRKLRRLIRKDRCSLRVDINGGWDADTIAERAAELQQYGVCVIEQPVYCSAEELVELAEKSPIPLMADESLLSYADGKILTKARDKIWWNIRISKNGGILPALKLMQLASEYYIPFTLGCMVGESSILSAAQRRLLQMGPVPKFVEGNWGKLLLADDLLPGRKSLRFGLEGKLKVLEKDRLGINVDQSKVEKYGQLIETLDA